MKSIKEQLSQYQFTNAQAKHYDALIANIMADEDVKQFLEEHQDSVTPEMIRNSYAKLYEFVSEKEKVKQTGVSQNPGFTPQLVANIGFIDVTYEPTQAFLVQQEKQTVMKRMTRLNMPEQMIAHRLRDIDVTEDRMPVLEYMINFVKQYDDKTTAQLKGVYLHGSYGIGKTHLLGALAHELALKGVPSYLVHFPSLVVELKASIKDNTVSEKLEAIKKSPLLMLDDIGGEKMTEWVRDDILMPLLQYRMDYRLPTCFTSNLSLEQLEEHLTQTTPVADERKAKRLMERMNFLTKVFSITGTNRRQN